MCLTRYCGMHLRQMAFFPWSLFFNTTAILLFFLDRTAASVSTLTSRPLVLGVTHTSQKTASTGPCIFFRFRHSTPLSIPYHRCSHASSQQWVLVFLFTPALNTTECYLSSMPTRIITTEQWVPGVSFLTLLVSNITEYTLRHTSTSRMPHFSIAHTHQHNSGQLEGHLLLHVLLWLGFRVRCRGRFQALTPSLLGNWLADLAVKVG
jgi:hypothetical protein